MLVWYLHRAEASARSTIRGCWVPLSGLGILQRRAAAYMTHIPQSGVSLRPTEQRNDGQRECEHCECQLHFGGLVWGRYLSQTTRVRLWRWLIDTLRPGYGQTVAALPIIHQLTPPAQPAYLVDLQPTLRVQQSWLSGKFDS